MAHTLIAYIFNIFSIFVKTAKNPKIGRKFQIENTIEKNQVKLARIMHNNLIEQLQLCVATSSLQNLFAHPATSFRLFCPALYAMNTKKECTIVDPIDKKRTLSTNNVNEPNKQNYSVQLSTQPVRELYFLEVLKKSIVQTLWIPENLVSTETVVILYMQYSLMVFRITTRL